MIYELSRDYARAWELIQRGDRLACWVDSQGYREIAETVSKGIGAAVCIACKGSAPYLYLWEDSYTFEMFKTQCLSKNIEFYLPIPDDKNQSFESSVELASNILAKGLIRGMFEKYGS